MAKSRSDELLERLHAQGLRKRTAKLLSQATDRRRKPAKAVERSLTDLRRVVADVEDHPADEIGHRRATPVRRGAAQAAAAAAAARGTERGGECEDRKPEGDRAGERSEVHSLSTIFVMSYWLPSGSVP